MVGGWACQLITQLIPSEQMTSTPQNNKPLTSLAAHRHASEKRPHYASSPDRLTGGEPGNPARVGASPKQRALGLEPRLVFFALSLMKLGNTWYQGTLGWKTGGGDVEVEVAGPEDGEIKKESR